MKYNYEPEELIHYHLGCKVKVIKYTVYNNIPDYKVGEFYTLDEKIAYLSKLGLIKVRLQLREVYDLSKEEKKDCNLGVDKFYLEAFNKIVHSPFMTIKLLKFGIDLFSLTNRDKADYNPEIYK